MRIAAFRAVGGYDESFSHNEDAELDYRLRQAGYRIWMTDKTLHDLLSARHRLPAFSGSISAMAAAGPGTS